MKNKIYTDFDTVIADVKDGAVIMFGNFGGPGGYPINLTRALHRKGTKSLTIIGNTAGGVADLAAFDDQGLLFENKQVKKTIASFPFSTSTSRPSPCEKQVLAGEVELELVPQGTLAERIRAAGAGIGAFYTPTGVDTLLEQGKERKIINGTPMLLEYALGADFAFIRAFKADKKGNLVYRGTARNFNPIMATAAKITIVEVDEIVEVGDLNPDEIVTPCIFVDRIIVTSQEKEGYRHLEKSFWVRKNSGE